MLEKLVGKEQWLFDVIPWYYVIKILEGYYVITGSHAHDTDLMIQELRIMLCVTLSKYM